MEEEVKEDVVAANEVKEQPEELENVSSEEGEDATGEAQGDDSEPKKPPRISVQKVVHTDDFESEILDEIKGLSKDERAFVISDYTGLDVELDSDVLDTIESLS